jgi:hypothetical protein
MMHPPTSLWHPGVLVAAPVPHAQQAGLDVRGQGAVHIRLMLHACRAGKAGKARGGSMGQVRKTPALLCLAPSRLQQLRHRSVQRQQMRQQRQQQKLSLANTQKQPGGSGSSSHRRQGWLSGWLSGWLTHCRMPPPPLPCAMARGFPPPHTRTRCSPAASTCRRPATAGTRSTGPPAGQYGNGRWAGREVASVAATVLDKGRLLWEGGVGVAGSCRGGRSSG